jgi:hypothetical protein
MNAPLPCVPRGAETGGMARHHSTRHPLFRQRWFADDIIITCVRWHLRFNLSLVTGTPMGSSPVARQAGPILQRVGALRITQLFSRVGGVRWGDAYVCLVAQ